MKRLVLYIRIWKLSGTIKEKKIHRLSTSVPIFFKTSRLRHDSRMRIPSLRFSSVADKKDYAVSNLFTKKYCTVYV